MCGRYSLKLSNSRKGKQLSERSAKLGLKYKEGEIFPGDQVLCVIPRESLIDLSVMKWGIQNRFFQINARYESLQDSISYADMKKRRCAVVCNGFYEWDADKRKYYEPTQKEFI